MELGKKLKEARTEAGLKQEELAKTIGVSRQTVSNWENNRSYPDIASVLRLSELYGITLDEMLKEDQNLRAHFEDRAAKKKRFWQLALEYGLVMEIVGILLAGQDFTGAGYGLQILGSIVVWISLWMHIRLFDHTKEEITRFCVGFGILMAGMAVEADGGVTLSCSENQQLQWRWLLRREYSCGLMSATFGHTMTTSPGWYLPEEPDPESYFRKTEDVVGKADITITLPGWGSERLTLQEEYHHADQVEYREYTLESKKAGVFELELETRYDGREEYALYRIDHAGGQFRFILTFAQGPQDAFYDLWAEK